MEHAEELAREQGEAELWALHGDRLARGDGRSARHVVEIALWALKRDVRSDPSTCVRGREVAVSGRLVYQEWQAKDGSKRSKHQVIGRVHSAGAATATSESRPTMASRAPESAGAPAATAAGALHTSRRLDGPLLRPDQAAALLAVKISWVYDAVRAGNLPCIRVGRHIRFTRMMLEEWLQGR